jgi:hypothetical protein
MSAVAITPSVVRSVIIIRCRPRFRGMFGTDPKIVAKTNGGKMLVFQTP